MYEKFSKLLQRKNVKAADVSRGTGIKQTVFSEWKKGKSTPKIDKLQKIADYFGVPIDYFIGNGKDDKPADTLTIMPQNKIHMIPVFGSVAAGFGAYASHYDNKKCTNFQAEFVQVYKSVSLRKIFIKSY